MCAALFAIAVGLPIGPWGNWNAHGQCADAIACNAATGRFPTGCHDLKSLSDNRGRSDVSRVGFYKGNLAMTRTAPRLARIASACGVLLLPAAMLLAPIAHAQPANAAPGTTGTSGGMAAPSTGAMAGKTSRADAGMLRDIAHANLAEIATGQLALEKAADPKVKAFAQAMVDDHTKALGDVTQLAQAKDVKLPDSPDVKHKAAMTKLKLMSGNSFDKSYVKTSGVGDHVATEKLLKKTQANAQDADLKALADKMLPVVQGHLKHAQELDGAKNK